MPSAQNNRQLLNDSSSLLKGIRHLRPRGSYDPLPPPGGYPLPAYIRRRFSFAPQLPNLSTLSLMPDFASSSTSLDEQADASVMQESSSLHVHYVPARRPERVSLERKLATLKKTPEIPSTYSDTSAHRRSVVADKVSNSSSVEVHNPSLSTHTTRGLRRVGGQNSLRAKIGRGTDIDTASEISSVHSKTASSVSTTPWTSLDSLEHRDDNGSDSIDTVDQEPYQLVRCLAEESPNLFGTFCILDLQLEGNPVRCATDDMIPIDRASDEYLFLDEEAFGTPYQLQTMLYGGQEKQGVPVAGTLIDVKDTTARASHRWVGLVDLTDFMRGLDLDIWLTVGYEEMDKAGIRRTSGKSKACPSIANPLASADNLGEVIQTLHRDYFIIGVTDMDERNWSITMVSPTLSASKDVRRPEFLDMHSMTDQLNVPLPFTTRVNWSMPGLHDKVYYIPMSGPELVCWLCFLVDNELPDLWPSLETEDTEFF
ncbi:MAG: hypothetical protein Q9212_003388 [Teloschistes hypoglaucus]